MPQHILTWLQRFRPEDPRRIKAFRAKLEGLAWDKQNAVESLSALFAAVDELAEAEVHYYYRRRGTRAWISGVTRTGAWLLGTVGLLLPLLAAVALLLFSLDADPLVRRWSALALERRPPSPTIDGGIRQALIGESDRAVRAVLERTLAGLESNRAALALR